jgi:hypothetical protein
MSETRLPKLSRGNASLIVLVEPAMDDDRLDHFRHDALLCRLVQSVEHLGVIYLSPPHNLKVCKPTNGKTPTSATPMSSAVESKQSTDASAKTTATTDTESKEPTAKSFKTYVEHTEKEMDRILSVQKAFRDQTQEWMLIVMDVRDLPPWQGQDSCIPGGQYLLKSAANKLVNGSYCPCMGIRLIVCVRSCEDLDPKWKRRVDLVLVASPTPLAVLKSATSWLERSVDVSSWRALAKRGCQCGCDTNEHAFVIDATGRQAEAATVDILCAQQSSIAFAAGARKSAEEYLLAHWCVPYRCQMERKEHKT